MNFLIHFLLISSISTLICEATDAITVQNNINNYFTSGGENLGILKGIKLRLIPGKYIGKTAHSVMWQGIYMDHINVAVKIFWSKGLMERELNVFNNNLNATTNPAIEQIGIPKVYYSGPILWEHGAIVMTLCHETLESYYQYNKKSEKLPDLTMLAILLQTITTLQYIHQMNVIHNDIKPENILLLGEKVFISGFDYAMANGQKNEGHTLRYASSKFFSLIPAAKRNRMDDLESLVYSMWHISGIPLGKWNLWYGFGIPEGLLLSLCYKQEEKIERVMEKLKHYKKPLVFNVMKYICVDEMLSGRPAPNYDQIIAKLSQAIADYKYYE